MNYLTPILYLLLQLSTSNEGALKRDRQNIEPITPITATSITCSKLDDKDSIAINEIKWRDNRKLYWDDFTAAPDYYSNFSAITSTYIEEMHGCNDDGDFIYYVKAVFVKNLSWSRDHYSEDLLEHEQIHFDITEYHARKLRRYFHNLQNPCETSDKEIKSTVDSLFNEMAKIQHLYDDHTHHGLEESNQETWADFVAKQLINYTSYKDEWGK